MCLEALPCEVQCVHGLKSISSLVEEKQFYIEELNSIQILLVTLATTEKECLK